MCIDCQSRWTLFEIKTRHLGTGILEAFGEEHVATGDPRLDQKLVFLCGDPDALMVCSPKTGPVEK